MSGGSYKIGYCNSCSRNVHYFRGPKTVAAKSLDVVSLFILNFGPWYCSHCERKKRCLPWIRKHQPTNRRITDRLNEAEAVGNFIRSDNSLVMQKKRSGRYSLKYREGVALRLIQNKTSIAQLSVELKVTESDLMAWVAELLESRDQRIEELSSLLRMYSRAASDLIGIRDETVRIDDTDQMIEGSYERRKANASRSTRPVD